MPEPAYALLLVLLFQIKHLIADFVLQSAYILQNRRQYGHPGGLLHVAIHAAGTLAILLTFGYAPLTVVLVILAEAAFHYHVDWAKDNLAASLRLTASSRLYWILLGTDQALHQASYLVIVWVLTRGTAAG